MMKRHMLAVLGAMVGLATLAPLPIARAGEDCCAGVTAAKATVRQAALQEVRAISARKQKGVIVDSRSVEDYRVGHIPRAVSVPMAKLATGLPRNKSTRLVFYCGGEQCPLSHKAAEKALKLGYKNVAVYKGGWQGWTQTASR